MTKLDYQTLAIGDFDGKDLAVLVDPARDQNRPAQERAALAQGFPSPRNHRGLLPSLHFNRDRLHDDGKSDNRRLTLPCFSAKIAVPKILIFAAGGTSAQGGNRALRQCPLTCPLEAFAVGVRNAR